MLFALPIYAQQGEVDAKDAARIERIWKQMLNSIAQKDTSLLRGMSLKKVSCMPCGEAHDGKGYYINADSFFYKAFAWPGTPLWQAITTKKYWVHTIVTSNRPENIDKGPLHYVIYELSFVTTEPDAANGNEGVSHLFQFIDVGGELKFYGLATVP